jgi:hypothetical protein
MRWLISIVLAATLAAPAVPQKPKPPDLSGTWKLNLSKSKPRENSKLDWGTLVIHCDGRTIHIQSESNIGNSTVDYTVDGVEHDKPISVSGVFSGHRYLTAGWQGPVLDIQVHSHSVYLDEPSLKPVDMRGEQRWSLASPRVLVQDSSGSGPLGLAFAEVLVYDKQ